MKLELNKKTILQLNLSEVLNKRVIVRVDFNVPLTEKVPLSSDAAVIADDTRIIAALPTINLLRGAGAKVVLMSHMGRPDGQVVEGLRMNVVGRRLNELLGCPVTVLNDCIGEDVREYINSMQIGDVVLLENLRFYEEETSRDFVLRGIFAKGLALNGDIFVNDAFGVAHRLHASTASIADHLPSVAGLLMAKELEVLGNALENPAHPFVVVLGGAKVSDKIPVIKNMIGKADTVLIGGGMAFTFMKAQGIEIGDSICDTSSLEEVKELMETAKSKGTKIVLPLDIVCSPTLANLKDSPTKLEVRKWDDGIPKGWSGYDIGLETSDIFTYYISNAKLIFWNGPMGVSENDEFDAGTEALAEDIAASGAYSIVGGGDSVAAVNKFKMDEKFGHISTGGGASLEFLAGKELPGVAALDDKE